MFDLAPHAGLVGVEPSMDQVPPDSGSIAGRGKNGGL